MRSKTDKQTGADAAKAARLRHLLDINDACGDMSDAARRHLVAAMDTAEGRAPDTYRDSAA